jgi:hypothetical protein
MSGPSDSRDKDPSAGFSSAGSPSWTLEPWAAAPVRRYFVRAARPLSKTAP